MRRTHNAWIFLAGFLLLPVGWWLMYPIGNRAAKQEYRNEEDLYTLLSLFGAMLLLLGVILIVTAIFRGLRTIDRLASEPILAQAQPAQDAQAP
jgi:hypothetical protein